MKLDGHTALVTGGASGLGAATARAFGAAGARVAIIDVDEAAVSELAHAPDGVGLACDVSDADAVERAFATVERRLGAARICVNCAGIAPAGRIAGRNGPLPLAEFSRVVQVNLIGTFNVMRLAAAAMQGLEPLDEAGERGVIINTASVAAFDGQIGQAAYSASKGGIAAMTLPAARELAQFGIRVLTIAPGIMDTPMLGAMPEEVRAGLAAAVPFPKRLGRPEEYASLARHLVENPLMNGEVVRLDGAIRMQPR